MGEYSGMRVLHLVKTSVGADWARRQMRELVALGLEVHVAVPPGGPMIPAYKAAGVVVHEADFDFPTAEPRRLPARIRGVRRLVSQIRPDIVHSHFVGTTLTMRLALAGERDLPRVFQVPGPLHLEHRPFRYLDLATAGPSDYWVATCRWTRERYRKSGVPASRVFLSYYATDVHRFDQPRRGTLRAELGLPEHVKLIGVVAYMYPPRWYLGQTRGLKGHEDVADAVALCLREEPRLLAVFVGGAFGGAFDYERRVRAYARARCGDQVVFLGTRSDIPEIYADLDLAVVASHSENTGGATEPLLAGRPTIATAVGGLPDVVIEGVTGWLVPPRRPELLANTILEVLTNPKEAEARASRGRDLAREMFDVKRNSAEMADVYSRILHAKRRRRSAPGRAQDLSQPAGLRASRKRISRAMDITVSILALALLSPVMVLVAAAIWLFMGKPILFGQSRPGLRGHPFILLKFRTMTSARDTQGRLLPDGERITSLGRWLRRTSLDELPQLFNVLRGDMALVGPRPLLMSYLERYTPTQVRRHEVKPGITGWAQINGRNGLTWEEKFELDLWYVNHQSLWLDLKILAKTVWKTLTGEGISQPGHATMEEFRG
jgi:lipopolysaccharide/colanic/teichoic acid biosynthesis glycosyltransferase/glycosyltransferase involved in cell wall biosynthesis